MKSAPLVLALLLAATLAPAPARAQASLDVAVTDVQVSPEPVVGVTSVIHAFVNSTAGGTVSVSFTYADGTGVMGADMPGSSGYTVVKVMQGAGQHDVNLTYTPTANRRGAQSIVVTASATGDTDPSNNTFTRSVFVADPALNVTFDAPATLKVLPEGFAPLRFFVHNLGNVNDTPNVTADVAAPWSATIPTPLPSIPPGGSAVGVVIVRGLTSDPNATLSLNLSAASSRNASLLAVAQAPLLRVNDTAIAAPRAFSLVGPGRLQLLPNVTTRISFTVSNGGAVDDVALVNLTHAPGLSAAFVNASNWPANLSRPVPDSKGTLAIPLASGESEPISVDVTPLDAMPDHGAYVALDAHSLNGPLLDATGYPISPVANLTLDAASPSLGLDAPRVPDPLYEGDDVSVGIRVSNVGLVAAQAGEVKVELRDNLRLIQSQTLAFVALPANASQTLTFSFSAVGMQGAFAIRAAFNASDAGVDPALASRQTTFTVRGIRLALDAPTSVSGAPGETLRFRGGPEGLAVENQGDDAETVSAWLDSPAPWLRGAWNFSLGPRETEPLALDLTIPDAPGASSFPATLHATLANRTARQVNASLVLTILDEAPPAVAWSDVASGRLGEASQLSATVTDPIGVGPVTLLVTDPHGQRLAYGMTPRGGGLYAANVTPSIAGTYTIQVQARDVVDPPRETFGDNLTWTVAGRPFAGVAPIGFGEGSFVSDRTLHFGEAVEASVASARADIGQGAFPLGFPPDVQLPSQDGPYTVTITSTSLDGQRMTQMWNVTLRTAPPRVANATGARLSDGRIEVHVDADPGANLTLRFQTDAGPVDYPFARSGSANAASLTVAPPAAWSGISVLATDKAGNHASVEVAMAKQKTPMPGAALALMSLAGLALALRMRRA